MKQRAKEEGTEVWRNSLENWRGRTRDFFHSRCGAQKSRTEHMHSHVSSQLISRKLEIKKSEMRGNEDFALPLPSLPFFTVLVLVWERLYLQCGDSNIK